MIKHHLKLNLKKWDSKFLYINKKI
jgi:hypothetical protein